MASAGVQAIVLAAGRAKRFNTQTSKLLATICGQEMVLYVTKALAELTIETTVVVGYQAESVKKVIETVHGPLIKFVLQEKQGGTGHAVLCTEDYWHADNILVMNGDMPLVTPDIIGALCEAHQKTNAVASIVVAHDLDPSGAYGRIVKSGNSLKIVEAKEFTADITEHPYINAGIYIFKRSFIEQYLPNLETNKTSNELHITDLIAIASNNKDVIATITVPFDRVRGINTLKELWQAEQIKRADIMSFWMLQGVRFAMPHTCHIDLNVRIGAGSCIEGNVMLRGQTIIGADCYISNGCNLCDAILADHVVIRPYTILENVQVKTGTVIGPFIYLRDQSVNNDFHIPGGKSHESTIES